MTVTTTNIRTDLPGNGSTTLFNLTIRPKNSDDFSLTLVNGITETALVKDTDFTVDMDNYQVTYPKAGSGHVTLPSGQSLVALLDLDLDQETDISNQGFYPETVEAELDRSRQIDQMQQEEIDRAVKVAVGSTTTPENYLSTVEGYKDDAETAATAAAADAVQTASDRIATAADVVLTGDDATATAADRVQTGLDAVATAADVISTAADAVSTAADRVQTGLDRVQTTADAVSTASDVTTTGNNVTAAAAAQTAAEAARDSTLASFDNFDDRYLGAKATDPTVDNDGDALVAGAIYFNTADGAMKVYTGSAWVAAYVSGTDFLAKANNLSDVNNAGTARTNLGVEIGSDVQAHSSVLDSTTASYTTAEETKLSGIATAATANDTDANLKDRANHTGTQTASTISDLGNGGTYDIASQAEAEAGAATNKNMTPQRVAQAIAALAQSGAPTLTAASTYINARMTGQMVVGDSYTDVTSWPSFGRVMCSGNNSWHKVWEVTAPVTGNYRFTARARRPNFSGNTQVRVYKNGVAFGTTHSRGANGTSTFTEDLAFTEGDRMEVWVNGNWTSTWNSSIWVDEMKWMNGELWPYGN